MESPFADPQPNTFAEAKPAAPAVHGWVGHVRTLSILCVIQGGAEIVAGGVCLFFGLIMPTVMTMPGPGGQPPAMPQGTEAITIMITVIYGAIGAILLILGILRIVAAVRTFQYRGRVLGIVSLSAGILSIVMFPCFPTAVGLMIYGMMIYLDPQVKAAFEARRAGLSVAQVQAQYGG